MLKSFLKELQKNGRVFLCVFFPEKCIVCRKEGAYLCAKHKELPPAPKNEAIFHFIDHVHATTAYHVFSVKKIVEFLKFRGFRSVGALMAKEIAEDVPKSFWHNAVLVPIPLHWTRKFWRGFNQSEILAFELTKQIPELKLSCGLRRIKRTQQQSKLSKNARGKNMQDVFSWEASSPVPTRVILVDDVVASGATLDSAGKVLKQAGVKIVDAVVFARGGKDN